MAATIAFTLDGRGVDARPGETLFEVAAREGIAIPYLCHGDGLRPDGNCRACVVEVAGERALKRRRHFAYGGFGSRGIHGKFQQIAFRARAGFRRTTRMC